MADNRSGCGWLWKDDQILNADPSLPSTSARNSGRIVVWKESCPRSPDAGRPILLVLSKEDKDLLHKIAPPPPPVDAEMKELETSGITFLHAES